MIFAVSSRFAHLERPNIVHKARFLLDYGAIQHNLKGNPFVLAAFISDPKLARSLLIVTVSIKVLLLEHRLLGGSATSQCSNFD